MPRVVAADYVSTWQQYPGWSLSKTEYKLSQWNCWPRVWLAPVTWYFWVISATCYFCYLQWLGCRTEYMNTQNHSAALEIGWTGFILDSQIDYPSNWGRVFVPSQSQQATLIACSTQPISVHCNRDEPGLGFHGKQHWLERTDLLSIIEPWQIERFRWNLV